MHPSASEQVQEGPSKSENLPKLRKLYTKFANMFEKHLSQGLVLQRRVAHPEPLCEELAALFSVVQLHSVCLEVGFGGVDLTIVLEHEGHLLPCVVFMEGRHQLTN